jgi:hypothetical protein
MKPRVTNVLPLDGYKLLLSFSNGEKRIYDCSSLLQFELFRGLRGSSYFNKVKVCGGTVVWPNNENICLIRYTWSRKELADVPTAIAIGNLVSIGPVILLRRLIHPSRKSILSFFGQVIAYLITDAQSSQMTL